MINLKHIVILLLLLIVSCKNNTIVKTQATNNICYKTKEVILSKNEMFVGHWFFESMNNKDSLNNKTFEINLYKISKDRIQGNYCSVSRNGNKIDCFKDDETNIFGNVKNDTLFVNFNSNWENSKGTAILYLIKDEQLFWKITKSKGELYLPSEIILLKR